MKTYKDRLAELRRTKIRHTREKRIQNGCTDMDDFGTVPLTDNYCFRPVYSDEGSFYGYSGMCENYCRLLDAHPAYVDPNEMLCGRWRDMLVNYRGDLHYVPEWRKKDPELKKLLDSGVTAQWSMRWNEHKYPYDHLKPLQKKYNIATGIDGDAHFACDYGIGFALGFGGLLEKIRKYRSINKGKEAFYDAEEKTVLAIIRFIDRHIEKINELLETEENPELCLSLREMKTACENIRLGAPKTFHEACQWAAFFNCASRIYTRDGAGFQLDVLLYPFYEKDIKEGILDDEKAKFLIANLLLIDPHYYQISGVDENDKDMTNRLSYLVLEAADSIDISCNITVRCHENCDKALFDKAVYYLLKNKNGWPRFASDKNLCEGYMRNGVDKATARQRIAVGCNWMCVPGREFPMNDTVKINIAKVFTEALTEMRGLPEKSSETLFALYEKHLKVAIDVTAKGVNHHIDHVWDVTPELVMNLLMKNTLETGTDISQCAELYTVGVDGAGLAVVADSFGAICTRIEEQKLLSWDELYAALDSNFADEKIRLMLGSSPKYCGGDTVSDRWAVRLTDSWVENIKAQSMPNGRTLVPGWFSWARTIEYGNAVPATPNGRRSGEPISHGANPNAGFRSDGAVSAQSNGIAKVQCKYGNTAPLQLEFDPKICNDEAGVLIVGSLIKAHFEQGGTLININVLDKKTLLEAHQNPDLHPDLVVRVTGFTAYFASLTPGFRQLVIDRFLEGD